jgi:quercetin dioxygenase-like cupin family protein
MDRFNFFESKLEDVENCHDGVGTIKFIDVFPPESFASGLMFMHHTVLPPGTTIGLHTHENDEEIYVVLEGQGLYTGDKERFVVKPGDVLRTKPFGTHGLENTENVDLKLIVFCVEV